MFRAGSRSSEILRLASTDHATTLGDDENGGSGTSLVSFEAVAGTTYQVAVEATGFKSMMRSDIRLDTDTVLTLKLQLEVGQITERVEKATGLCLTAHQFRHAAAAVWLKAHPGDYETVRRMLGHRNIQTTINFYCGLETLQANKMFGDLVRKLMKFEPEPA